MIRSASALLGFTILVMVAATPGQGQEYIHVNGWYEVSYTKFKPTCVRRALQIIHEHFVQMDRTIGREVIPFDFTTGEWDHVVYFPIALTNEGYDTMPPRSEWWEALYEQEGGKEEGDALFGEFLECIARSRTELARLVLESPEGR